MKLAVLLSMFGFDCILQYAPISLSSLRLPHSEKVQPNRNIWEPMSQFLIELNSMNSVPVIN